MDEIKIDLIPVEEKIGAAIKAEIIRMCPVDRGDLRRSIGFRVKGNVITWFSTDPKASDLEYGTPPEPLSPQEMADLANWAERHGASPFRIVKYIERHGIRVGTVENPLHITSYGRDSYRPFMRPGVFQNIELIKNIIIGGFS
jgi:hypothetical protein